MPRKPALLRHLVACFWVASALLLIASARWPGGDARAVDSPADAPAPGACLHPFDEVASSGGTLWMSRTCASGSAPATKARCLASRAGRLVLWHPTQRCEDLQVTMAGAPDPLGALYVVHARDVECWPAGTTEAPSRCPDGR